MASPLLAGSPAYTDFFHRRILLNTQYWCGYVEDKAADTTALEAERERIVKAIAFALDLAEAWSLVYRLIINFSPLMERRGHWEIWNQLLARAIVVAQIQKDGASQTTLTALLARLLFQQSRFKESVYYYRQTIQLARPAGDKFNEGRACTNLGFYYIEKGQWRRAEVLCCHALALFEQLDNHYGCAHTDNHLGILYTRQHRWELAQQYLERACALWQSMPDDHGLMRGFINLGWLYNEMESPDKALPYFQDALHLAMLTGEEAEIARIYANIGIAYRLKGEPAQAEAYAWQAEAIFQRFAHSLGLAQVYDNLGLACLDQAKWQEAEMHLESALQIWRNLGSKWGEIRSLTYLIEYELARGDSLRATIRLAEVERLISSYGQASHNSDWPPLLAKYHRLMKRAGQTSEVLETPEV
ncbi:MAG: tetratricopeptide repeat protein [Anaerolineales bacterium]|nr:tetratricopeptide repeat protein [Anaerolineales bacterium]